MKKNFVPLPTSDVNKMNPTLQKIPTLTTRAIETNLPESLFLLLKYSASGKKTEHVE